LRRTLPRMTSKPERPRAWFSQASSSSRCSRRRQQVAASRQEEQGSRARDTTKCVTRCKNGVNCEVCVFCCYCTQSRVASNRRTVYSKSSLPELALMLSARSPVNPAAFLVRQKWREMRNTRFSLLWHSVARRKQQEKHSPASRVC